METTVRHRKDPRPTSEAQKLSRINKRKERAQQRIESKTKKIHQSVDRLPMKIATWNVERVNILETDLMKW